ncbi:MAG: hypothetical protein M1365_11705, partial [Actinobacteria bacterium]|nr:hypothetical protein [Actinomycetota bacterium]
MARDLDNLTGLSTYERNYNIDMGNVLVPISVGRPALSKEETDVIFRKLEPYLKMGLSINKVCNK